LAPASSSDPWLWFALSVAAGALGSALLLLVSISAMRLWRRWRAHALAPRIEAWREAMHVAMEDPAAARLPPIAAMDLTAFAGLWNHFQESVRGAAAENLAALLRERGIDDRLLRLLRRRSLRLKLIAITSLGHLREERAWSRLEEIAREPSSVTSFAAARALLRIEPRRALQVLGSSILEREDWPLTRLGTILHELGPAVVTPALVTLLVSRPRRGLERAIKLARFGHRHRIATIVRGWLSSSDEPEVIAAALDYVEDASDLPWVRGAAKHGEWRVRMAAAKALARVGSRSELAVLLELLRDPVWWVRYHAAQALTSLHGLDPGELEMLREGTRDAFASDMLAQALAERRRR
jgi:HEAT repeat protein